MKCKININDKQKTVEVNNMKELMLLLASIAFKDLHKLETGKNISLPLSEDIEKPISLEEALTIIENEIKVRYGDNIKTKTKITVVNESYLSFWFNNKTHIYYSVDLENYMNHVFELATRTTKTTKRDTSKDKAGPVIGFEEAINFVVHFRNTDKFEKYIKQVPEYNNFSYKKAINIVNELSNFMPRTYYNKGNCNNGQMPFDVAFGREGSCVMYLIFNDYVKNINSILHSKEYRKILVNFVLELSEADEVGFLNREVSAEGCPGLPLSSHIMRIWWD